jgi:glycosyltransferase involved in cell wall biosynthesis
MKILIVCSGNANYISPFILDQAKAIKEQGLVVDFFLIKGKGLLGYFKNYGLLKDKIRIFTPDIIHAHYGLSGLLASLQRKIPVVTTFHGSDINISKIRPFSWLASKLSAANILVSEKLMNLMPAPNGYLIPCGVDEKIFAPMDKSICREELKFDQNKKYILFSSSFSNKVKNYSLAKEAIDLLVDQNITLLELKGYSRNEVSKLMNAVDAVLLTSFTEGSPQFIKEAMACNRPIVSTDVGDVRWLFGDIPGHYLASFNPSDVADKIEQAISFSQEHKFTYGSRRIVELGLVSDNISKRLISLYNVLLDL